MEARLLEALQEHGFTASDAKAYVALLRSHPATGYELAARSGVPRSAIYNVLRRLEGLGLVNAVSDKPAKYAPLPPQRLLAMLQSRFSRNLESLDTALEGLSLEGPEAATWTVQGYDSTLEQAGALIAAAERSVYASAWRREVDQLTDALRAANDRGVEIILFSFNPLPEALGTTFSYGIEQSDLEEYWPHKLILVVDGTRALAGGTEPHVSTRTVVTEEPALIEMAVSNLVLDITLLGQRQSLETGPTVTRLTRLLAPIEKLGAAT